MPERLRAVSLAVVLPLLFSACSESAAMDAWGTVRSAWQKLTGSGEGSSSVSSAGTQDRFAQGNSELLQEVYRVVWQQDPTDVHDFQGWLEALNQGASLEGVYNGFTHSDRYRALEQSQKGATVKALKVFATELARLTRELPEPTHFAASAAQPLPMPVEPEFAVENAVVPQSGGAGAQTKNLGKDLQKSLEEEYARVFVGSSAFTLKRVLGDQALLVLHHKESDRERLADWYSKWAADLSAQRVDFGLKLRNDPALSLHYSWAMAASVDRVAWEMLNRLHRLMNAAN